MDMVTGLSEFQEKEKGWTDHVVYGTTLFVLDSLSREAMLSRNNDSVRRPFSDRVQDYIFLRRRSEWIVLVVSTR